MSKSSGNKSLLLLFIAFFILTLLFIKLLNNLNQAKKPIFSPGVYQGLLPAADCNGIKITIDFSQYNIFTKREDYLNCREKNEPIFTTGTWSFSKGDIKIQDKDDSIYYKVLSEMKLIQLGENREEPKEMAQNYTLIKNNSNTKEVFVSRYEAGEGEHGLTAQYSVLEDKPYVSLFSDEDKYLATLFQQDAWAHGGVYKNDDYSWEVNGTNAIFSDKSGQKAYTEIISHQ